MHYRRQSIYLKASLTMCTLFVCIVLSAGNRISVVYGKAELKGILKEDVTIPIIFDWSETTYKKVTDVKEEWYGLYDYITNDCEKSFVSGFNECTKGAKFSRTDRNAKYKCILKITNIDCYFKLAHVPPGNKGKMWGTFKIISIETGETIAEVRIDGVQHSRDMFPQDCYGKTFLYVGEKIAKL